MKVIIKYEASDGSQFDSKACCEEYEKLSYEVESETSKLPTRPVSCDYANGAGYIQHTKERFDDCKLHLLDLIATKIKHDWVQQTKEGKAHSSYVARLLDDYGIRCLRDAWYRIICTDNLYREWGQPFYALNPDSAHIQKQINL